MEIFIAKASYDHFLNTPEERIDSVDKESSSVIPMTIPLPSGPGHHECRYYYQSYAATDQALLRAALDPKFTIHGFRRADLKPYLPTVGWFGITQDKTLAYIWHDQARAWHLSLLPVQTVGLIVTLIKLL